MFPQAADIPSWRWQATGDLPFPFGNPSLWEVKILPAKDRHLSFVSPSCYNLGWACLPGA